MIDSRNKISHIYHQKKAEEIALDIPKYCELMEDVINRLKTF